ncbi:hypothetical protein GIB67_001645 [Kingdonia uniflora]|uniref:Pentatricopeptide repeat-containing protein n=1 Tax=Kingdonia uniflora TaxID=39325 RepID=A0A7J7L0T9_9MAGN|nr:hypothetical protein GIB67_001645 [Kingdonia uniflora]
MNNVVIRWPRFLTPTQLSQIIRNQNNPLTALQIFHYSKTKYPNYKHNGPVYTTMINILANSDRLSEMKSLLHEMKHDSSCQFNESIFVTAINAYSNAGLLDEAVSLYKTLPHFNCVDWTQSFFTLLELLLKDSRFDTACRLYLDSSIHFEVKCGIRGLNILIGTLCSRKRSDIALDIFMETYDQACYPDRETYKLLMKGLCDDGRLNDATHLLYSMFRRISQKGCGQDVVIYRILLEALCDNGQVEEAAEILHKVLRKGLKAPRRNQASNLSQRLERESLEGVKCLVNEALLRGGVPSSASYSAMVNDLYSEGRIEEGNRVFDEMRERGFRPPVSTYEGKITALCKQGRADFAEDVVEKEMVQWNFVPTVRTYNILIKGLCMEGKSMRAVRYLSKMVEQVGCVANEESYGILVDGLCSEGHFVEASKAFDKMLDNKYRPNNAAYNKVIGGLCIVDRRYEAVLWLEEMVSHGRMPEVCVWNLLVLAVCFDSTEASVFVDILCRVTNS